MTSPVSSRPASASRSGGLSRFVALVRPKQWIKNLFVLAPLIFARELFHPEVVLLAVRAFLGFCFAASIVYIINDMADLEADRVHPEKKHRPLASGAVTPGEAFLVLAFLAVLVVVVVYPMPAQYIAILCFYLAMNLAYSYKLKEVVLLDVFIIAAGFMFRVLSGAFAIHVGVSSWIILCTLFVSLFLGFAKRRGELLTMEGEGTSSERKVLQRYSITFIDQMLTIAAAGAVISYALYTVAPRTIAVFGTEHMIYTTIFVLYGIFRYLYLIHFSHSTENPTNAVTSDRTIILVVVLWVLTCVFLIYFARDPLPMTYHLR